MICYHFDLKTELIDYLISPLFREADDEASEGCARTVMSLQRKEGSKSHLRSSVTVNNPEQGTYLLMLYIFVCSKLCVCL